MMVFRRRRHRLPPSAGAGGAAAAAESSRHDQRLRRERDRFLGFAFAAGCVLLEVKGNGRIGFAAGALRTFFGRPASRLVGRPLLDLIAEADRGAVGLALLRLRTQRRLLPLPIRLAGASGPDRIMVLSGCRLPIAGETVHLSLRTATPAETVPERDPTSGLLERAGFERTVKDRLGPAAAEQPVRLSFLELEGLDALCRRLDPAEAERLPLRLGSLLQDASSDGRTAARLAHERFGLLHRPDLKLDGLEQDLADSLRAIDPLGAGISPRSVTIPLDVEGLSETDAEKAVGFVIRKFADGRMSEGTRLHSLRASFDALLEETVARITDYREVLNDDRLQLVFQPIVRLVDGKLHHYEALTRTQGGVSPARLVDFAEAIDLVGELDLAVCRRVIRSLDRHPALAIAVNLSGRSLENDVFVAALLELLDRAQAIRERLSFELTETAEVRDLAAVDQVVQEIRGRGSDVGLDDFGAGASTFHYLRAFRVDFVKIDGSLIRSNQPRDRAITRSVAILCRELGIRTIAEMVETREQADWLRALEVDLGQGFLFGRPRPDLP